MAIVCHPTLSSLAWHRIETRPEKKSYLKERKENNLSKAAPQISVWTDSDAFPLLTRK